jgi:hypothetical protein
MTALFNPNTTRHTLFERTPFSAPWSCFLAIQNLDESGVRPLQGLNSPTDVSGKPTLWTCIG